MQSHEKMMFVQFVMSYTQKGSRLILEPCLFIHTLFAIIRAAILRDVPPRSEGLQSSIRPNFLAFEAEMAVLLLP